jgi:hypothetical protein
MVNTHRALLKVSSVSLFKKFESPQQPRLRTTKILKATMLDTTDKYKEKSKQETIISKLCETFTYVG